MLQTKPRVEINMAIRWFKKRKPQDDASAPPSGEESRKNADADSREAPPADAGKDGSVQESEPVEPETGAAADQRIEESKSGFFGRLRKGLSKTRKILTTDIDDLFLGKKELDAALLEELEERLITADLGVQTTMALMERISKRARKISGAQDLKAAIKEEMLSMIAGAKPHPPEEFVSRPRIILVLGVNGVGKTTTIGKLAARAVLEGQKVLIAAADTFRAAAIEQLEIWARRAGADFVRHKDGADPAAVAFDSIEAAIARDMDLVLVDTAGRLHTKVNLMAELKKIKRTIGKKIPDAPHESLLVLDATTGQNALSQAKLFHEEVGITGLVMTKLDGTAKGGVVVSVCNSMQLPLHYIGVGEKIDDLQPFDPEQYVDAIL